MWHHLVSVHSDHSGWRVKLNGWWMGVDAERDGLQRPFSSLLQRWRATEVESPSLVLAMWYVSEKRVE